VIDPRTGKIVAGARAEDGKGFRDSMAAIMSGYRVVELSGANTTIGVVATNAPFTKAQMTKIAQMAHDGLARAINPVHTASDGDTIFAMSTGTAQVKASTTAIGAIAATVLSRAIVRAVMQAEGLKDLGLPSHRDYVKS
jgi:L-aminopeptidase/D-esterase-like protein